jgi:Domain of unknown function (DUF4398)
MIQLSNFRRPSHRLAAMILGLSAVLSFSAYAAKEVDPTQSIKAAEQAIATADQARVADTSLPELSEAREKLTAAQTAAQGKHPVEAERLALEARAVAELASAKVEAAKAKAVNDEIRSSTATLKQEMQRNSGVTQ